MPWQALGAEKLVKKMRNNIWYLQWRNLNSNT